MPEQRIVPMLAYEDAGAAIEWLRDAFGFEEVADQRYTDDDGTVTHAELRVGDSAIFLATPNKEYESPRHHRQTCEAAGRWLDNPWVIDGVYVGVDDLDGHFERARAAGATILRSPEDPGIGQRIYSAEDLEGHRWMFGETT